jgi:hypothetical protein
MRTGMMTNSGFTSTDQSEFGHRGFCIEFSNGYSVSVQWGWMNYCSNRGDAQNHKDRVSTSFNSKTAEVLLMWKGEFVPVNKFPRSLFLAWQYSFDDFGVAGNLSADSVGRLIRDVVSLDREPLD